MENKQPLISIKDLFKDSFEIYKQKFWIFIKLASINIVTLLAFIPFVLLFYFSLFYSPINNIYLYALSFIYLTIYIIVSIIISFLVQIAFIFIAKERNSSINMQQSLLKAWSIANSFVWISFLVGLCVLGGFILFIIPGIIFATYFSFSNYILVSENKKGKLALIESKRLVKGNWWQIFGRLLTVGIFAAIISWIPFLGSFINIFFTTPFIYIYTYLMYEDLKKIKS